MDCAHAQIHIRASAPPIDAAGYQRGDRLARPRGRGSRAPTARCHASALAPWTRRLPPPASRAHVAHGAQHAAAALALERAWLERATAPAHARTHLLRSIGPLARLPLRRRHRLRTRHRRRRLCLSRGLPLLPAHAGRARLPIELLSGLLHLRLLIVVELAHRVRRRAVAIRRRLRLLLLLFALELVRAERRRQRDAVRLDEHQLARVQRAARRRVDPRAVLLGVPPEGPRDERRAATRRRSVRALIHRVAREHLPARLGANGLRIRPAVVGELEPGDLGGVRLGDGAARAHALTFERVRHEARERRQLEARGPLTRRREEVAADVVPNERRVAQAVDEGGRCGHVLWGSNGRDGQPRRRRAVSGGRQISS
eukprot:3552132-Prymnesium_polylepis.1